MNAKLLLALVVSFCAQNFATATLIPVPNGDFSDSANNGSIGGGALGGSASNVTIGAGPWTGTYSGVAALLSPPTLTIGGGNGTISGITGTGIVTNLNNSAFFFQALTVGYTANTTYTLTVDITSTQPITMGILGNGNAGIALTGMSGTLASTTTANPSQITLTPQSGTTTEVALQFTTGSVAPAGNIGIQLFAAPNGVQGANLLQTVSFDNVTLDEVAVPESNAITWANLGLAVLAVVKFHSARRKTIQ